MNGQMSSGFALIVTARVAKKFASGISVSKGIAATSSSSVAPQRR
jgi:hypothetical protein